jgi:hypothetical protein
MRLDDPERINAYELEVELRTENPRQRKEWSGEGQLRPSRLEPGCSSNMMMKSRGGSCGTYKERRKAKRLVVNKLEARNHLNSKALLSG